MSAALDRRSQEFEKRQREFALRQIEQLRRELETAMETDYPQLQRQVARNLWRTLDRLTSSYSTAEEIITAVKAQKIWIWEMVLKDQRYVQAFEITPAQAVEGLKSLRDPEVDLWLFDWAEESDNNAQVAGYKTVAEAADQRNQFLTILATEAQTGKREWFPKLVEFWLLKLEKEYIECRKEDKTPKAEETFRLLKKFLEERLQAAQKAGRPEELLSLLEKRCRYLRMPTPAQAIFYVRDLVIDPQLPTSEIALALEDASRRFAVLMKERGITNIGYLSPSVLTQMEDDYIASGNQQTHQWIEGLPRTQVPPLFKALEILLCQSATQEELSLFLERAKRLESEKGKYKQSPEALKRCEELIGFYQGSYVFWGANFTLAGIYDGILKQLATRGIRA